jgi:hypothetical protein
MLKFTKKIDIPLRPLFSAVFAAAIIVGGNQSDDLIEESVQLADKLIKELDRTSK